MTQSKWGEFVSRNRMLALILVIAGVFAIGAYLGAAGFFSGPPKVTVQGSISSDYLVSSITFTNANGGNFTAQVHSQVYQISLPAGNIYGVSSDLPRHYCSPSSLSIPADETGTITANFEC